MFVFVERYLTADAHDWKHVYIYFSDVVLTYYLETLEHYLDLGLLVAGVTY